MYSQLIVERNLHRLKQQGIVPKPRSVADSIEIARRLKALFNAKSNTYSRPLTSDEKEFTRSETLLCRYDFRYFAARYGCIDLDASAGGGVGPVDFWTSQLRALELIAKREEEIADQFARYGFTDGILTVWHKSRQLGATAIMRLITFHRMLLYRNTRAIAASLDIDKVHELYVRDKTILDNLPPFLQPAIEFDVKDTQISFETLKSRLTYQQANQDAGVGTGQQFDLSHMTEVALWRWAERLKLDFLPAVPQAPTTFVGWESTANGRGNFWHTFTESVRKKEEGFQSWTYIFTPSYIEPKKYRRIPPDNWVPNTVTLQYADLVERTSAEYCGETVRLGKDQLYWWESEYAQYKREGSLHIFLSNYCATPEQSFQHSTRSALPLETVERMRSTAILGMPYHFELTGKSSPSEPGAPYLAAESNSFPQMFTIGTLGKLYKMDPREFDGDARGIIWLWEPPNRGATYTMGVDPTVGRTGWSRYSRVKEDAHTDNGTIQVVRVGKDGKQDMQVAEFAAPVDAFDLAYIVNVLGRMYAGKDEDQCKCIIEVYPGPGSGTLQTCLELGYTNHFRWEYYGDTAATPTKAMGWHAGNKTNRDLWVKSSRHLVLDNVVVRSPWLVEEYADCRMNVDRDYAENPGGHDDRVRAFNLALWIANSWSMNVERTTEKVATHDILDAQRSDMSLDEIHASWDEMFG